MHKKGKGRPPSMPASSPPATTAAPSPPATTAAPGPTTTGSSGGVVSNSIFNSFSQDQIIRIINYTFFRVLSAQML